jgi:hypothetical protein
MSGQGEHQQPGEGLSGRREIGGTETLSSGDAPSGTPIEINGHEIHPSSQLPAGEFFEDDASRTNYILVQFTHLPSVEEEGQLKALKVQVGIRPLLSLKAVVRTSC